MGVACSCNSKLDAALGLQAAFYSRQLEKETLHVLLALNLTYARRTTAVYTQMLRLDGKLVSGADSGKENTQVTF